MFVRQDQREGHRDDKKRIRGWSEISRDGDEKQIIPSPTGVSFFYLFPPTVSGFLSSRWPACVRACVCWRSICLHDINLCDRPEHGRLTMIPAAHCLYTQPFLFLYSALLLGLSSILTSQKKKASAGYLVDTVDRKCVLRPDKPDMCPAYLPPRLCAH